MKKVVVPADKWKWFGTAAHFCGGHWCRFHMATQVGGYLISSVGHYINPRNSGGSEAADEEIGHGRKYEVMVFKAGVPCLCGCGVPGLDSSELDFLGSNSPAEAQENHMKMCKKWANQ